MEVRNAKRHEGERAMVGDEYLNPIVAHAHGSAQCLVPVLSIFLPRCEN